jgi:NADH dehydrogenase
MHRTSSASATGGPPTQRQRVVVIGGGFGGLQAAQHLATAPVDMTIVDRRNFHLFQPLTYQVATGALSPGEVAYPLRAIFRRHANVRVLMAEVTDLDLDRREVRLADGSLPYDTLIVAGGSHYSYFGHDDWRRFAPEVKSLESALATRARILSAFEEAETELVPARRRALLTFVVVGAGPTGVEMAGHIAELAPQHAARRFPLHRLRAVPSPVDRDRRPRADRLPALAVAQSRALPRVPWRHAAAAAYGCRD